MIAALFVEEKGVYSNLPGVIPWGIAKDARKYIGPWPVIAHPPCQRWGRYWSGGPSAKVRRKRGDDGGCFASALSAVRQWGGILEHPADSSAWAAFSLMCPPRSGGWVVADWLGGWTCCVEQGHYGHRARKATWLYANGVDLPILKWGPSIAAARLDQGFHSAEERARFRAGLRQDKVGLDPAERKRSRDTYERLTGRKHFARLGTTERAATPVAFRDLLISIALSAHGEEAKTA